MVKSQNVFSCVITSRYGVSPVTHLRLLHTAKENYRSLFFLSYMFEIFTLVNGNNSKVEKNYLLFGRVAMCLEECL